MIRMFLNMLVSSVQDVHKTQNIQNIGLWVNNLIREILCGLIS